VTGLSSQQREKCPSVTANKAPFAQDKKKKKASGRGKSWTTQTGGVRRGAGTHFDVHGATKGAKKEGWSKTEPQKKENEQGQNGLNKGMQNSEKTSEPQSLFHPSEAQKEEKKTGKKKWNSEKTHARAEKAESMDKKRIRVPSRKTRSLNAPLDGCLGGLASDKGQELGSVEKKGNVMLE